MSTKITKDKVFELAKKYNLEYENVSTYAENPWWEFYLPVGYVDNCEDFRDNLFAFDEDWMNENGEYTTNISIYNKFKINSGIDHFNVYYNEDCANVSTMEELEKIVSAMVKLGSRWNVIRKEMNEMIELFKVQEDF